MIENRFIHYETLNGFQADKENIADNSIVFVKENNKIYTHGAEYGGASKTIDIVDDVLQMKQSELNMLFWEYIHGHVPPTPGTWTFGNSLPITLGFSMNI